MNLGVAGAAGLKLKKVFLDPGGGGAGFSMGDVAPFAFERTDSFSVSCWLRFTTTTFCMWAAKSTTTRGYTLRVNVGSPGNPGRIGVGMSSDFPGGNALGCDTTAGFNDGAWHHFVMAYGGTSNVAGIDLYVDGVLQTKVTEIDALSATILAAEPLSWGLRLQSVSTFDFPFTGDVSDLAVYDKKLSGAEVTAIYAQRCPPNLLAVGPFADLVGWWRPTLTDVLPNVVDVSGGGNPGVMAAGTIGTTIALRTR